MARDGDDRRDRVQPVPGVAERRALGEQDDDDPLLRSAVDQLAAYFAARPQGVRPPARAARHRLPAARLGAAARRSAYGETASYGEIAHRLGKTNAASRAVGLANGRNPIPIVIPCHRVIGANGTLTGYAGGLRAQAAAARAGAGRPVLSSRWSPAGPRLTGCGRGRRPDPRIGQSPTSRPAPSCSPASANLAIAIAKLVGGLVSGSTAMLAEAAHSFADTLNQVFLMAALKRSKKPADARHPFGYGMERYFWSLIAAVGIFVLGAGYSIFEGIKAVLEPEELGSLMVAYVVLALSFLFEGASWLKAVRQLRGEAEGEGRGFFEHLQDHARPDRQDGRLRGHRRAGRHRARRGRHHPAPPDRPRVTGTALASIADRPAPRRWSPTRSASRTSAR